MALLARAAEQPAVPAGLPRVEDIAFTHALVALAAKLVAVDGAANAAESLAFTTLFLGEHPQDAKLKSLFVQRLADDSSALQYARQVMNATYGQVQLHKELLDRLLTLATADAALNAAELELLRAVAAVFNLRGEGFKSLVMRHMAPAESPYAVLGIDAHASDEALREHYMARVQKLHPDRYLAAGASAETVAMLSDQLAAVNAAYETVRRQRARKFTRAFSSGEARRNNKGAKANAA